MVNNLSRPLVSVIMPVYNGQEFIRDAIESILRQSYTNFELIIIDDGSTDDTEAIISTYNHESIVYIKQVNKGVSVSRNRGIKLARGKYIVMHDADDISVESRLKKQVDFLEANKEVGLVGSNYHVISDKSNNVIFTTNVFTCNDDLKLALVFSNQFGQGTIAARAELLKKNLYTPSMKYAEDYELWTRISTITKIANLCDPLYKWRLHENSVSSVNSDIMSSEFCKIRDNHFKHYLDYRKEYKITSFHPGSIRLGLTTYLKLKNTLFRDMSLLYYYRKNRPAAIASALIALIYAPWVFKTYKLIYQLCKTTDSPVTSEYEYI